MRIVLEPEIEARLVALAAEQGQDPNELASVLLIDALQRAEDPDAALSETQREQIRAGIASGFADSDAGRARSAEDAFADMYRRYGITSYPKTRESSGFPGFR